MLKEEEDFLQGEIISAEREIIPQINELFNTKDAIAHQINLKTKYNNQIHALKEQIENLKNNIVDRIKVIKSEDKRLLNKIK